MTNLRAQHQHRFYTSFYTSLLISVLNSTGLSLSGDVANMQFGQRN